MNGRPRCHVPAPGTAVQQVQCVRIGDRVTIHDEDIRVEPTPADLD